MPSLNSMLHIKVNLKHKVFTFMRLEQARKNNKKNQLLK